MPSGTHSTDRKANRRKAAKTPTATRTAKWSEGTKTSKADNAKGRKALTAFKKKKVAKVLEKPEASKQSEGPKVSCAPRRYSRPVPDAVPSLPSGNMLDPWLYAQAPRPFAPTPYTGKWMLRVSATDVDETWAKIKVATAAGELGISAKVSTLLNNRYNPRSESDQTHVIMVYTRDCRDVGDVAHILHKLRDMGFSGRLSYKEDGATYANVYGTGAALYVAQPQSVTPDRRREPIPVPAEHLSGNR